jgi:hypothetical protein
MFLFSVLHLFAFPYDMYQVNTLSQKPLIHEVNLGGSVMKGVAHSVNQLDIVTDTIDTFGPTKKRDEDKNKKVTMPPFRL